MRRLLLVGSLVSTPLACNEAPAPGKVTSNETEDLTPLGEVAGSDPLGPASTPTPSRTLRAAVVKRTGELPTFPEIDAAVQAVKARTIDTRRRIHENPELGEREEETAKLVADRLTELGLAVETGLAKTGVVGVLEGESGTGVVAWRADMDALPITENTDLPFASKKTDTWEGQEVGVMHACGHDVHTSVALGLAEVLVAPEVRKRIRGKVVFLFQPAEEGVLGPGPHGADAMVRAGALKNPKPDAVMGFHVDSRLGVGEIGLISGGALAAADRFEVSIQGAQAHGAYPQDAVDPVVVASQTVMALQTIASRNVDTRQTVVVTVGQIEAGNRFNIIPDSARLVGTIRTHDERVQEMVHQRVKEIVENTAKAMGAKAKVTIEKFTPVTFNNPELMATMRPVFGQVAGEDMLKDELPHMGAEDFAFYAKDVPGLFFFVGVSNPKKGITGLAHTPEFAVDEDAIPVALKTAAALVLTYLEDLAAAEAG